MADYGALLDDQIRAYIARTDSYYPPGAVDLTVAEQRAVYNTMCAAFHTGRPDGVAVRDEVWANVPCRRYDMSGAKAAATVIYYHGGGFVVGGLDSHDDICAEICAATGYRVISVDYALAPEHVFPRCFNDAWDAFCAIAGHFAGAIVLAGDSAGGNLAAAVAHHARHHSAQPIGLVLIYPGLGGDQSRGSYVDHADAPHLSVRDLGFYAQLRSGGAHVDDDPRFAPLRDRDFSGLPPCVIVTAQCDPLSSDGEAYRDAIVGAGGRALWIEEPGLIHGYLRARGMSDRAAASFGRILVAVRDLGRQEWPPAI
jgi:acetyl esterase